MAIVTAGRKFEPSEFLNAHRHCNFSNDAGCIHWLLRPSGGTLPAPPF
jgi:hypothetical protein